MGEWCWSSAPTSRSREQSARSGNDRHHHQVLPTARRPWPRSRRRRDRSVVATIRLSSVAARHAAEQFGAVLVVPTPVISSPQFLVWAKAASERCRATSRAGRSEDDQLVGVRYAAERFDQRHTARDEIGIWRLLRWCRACRRWRRRRRVDEFGGGDRLLGIVVVVSTVKDRPPFTPPPGDPNLCINPSRYEVCRQTALQRK